MTASWDSAGPTRGRSSSGRPSLVTPHAASTGSAAQSWKRKWLASRYRYRYFSFTSVRVRCFHASNSSLIASHTRETVDLLSAACGPGRARR